MGTAGIKIKLMPKSPDADLAEIEQQARAIIEKHGGLNHDYAIEPIAFGLKAIIAFFELSENIEPGQIEEALKKITGISSVQVIDMRRLM